MAAIKTARDRARAELTQEIKEAARRQLGEVGAQALSLRAVARELGMVSSALYRYFAGRDQLLTALIVDAYDAIGDAAEKADDPTEEPRIRWRAIWHAARDWAKEHPHEYALIYGTPIPGYAAPQDTVAPAARVALALVHVATTAPLRPAYPGPTVPSQLQQQAREITTTLEGELSPAETSRILIAWTQLFGVISFELFGQYARGVDPADSFFTYTAMQMADFVGLK